MFEQNQGLEKNDNMVVDSISRIQTIYSARDKSLSDSVGM